MPTAYVAAPPEAAEELATQLVEDGVAACVNALDCRSVYRWVGTVREDPEVVLLAKTTDERFANLRETVEEYHPYEVPCIERFDGDEVGPPSSEPGWPTPSGSQYERSSV